jgi:ribosomal-protein-alanine N-acetyltransferase
MDPLLTNRLVLRELTLADAPFALELLNDPGFHRFIGDRGIRDLAGAEKYLADGPIASYAKRGHGLWMVELKEGRVPVGICGLIQRDTLPHPDLGFAFLARHCGQGYGSESAAAALAYGRSVLKLPTILAITALENPASIKLLGKLGFRFERIVTLAGIATPSRLFVAAP